MAKVSAGLLLFRVRERGVEVLIAHMGGPFWANRVEGSWTVPKGLVEPGEDPLDTAQREFEEEMGSPAPSGPYISLGEITQASGKVVHAWAVEANFEVDGLRSNTMQVEWPPRSGNLREYPEIDRAEWVLPSEVGDRLIKGHEIFIDRLLDHLDA
jgi:predicted NUDIX family NTP pyrophosphohydrolase